MRYKTKLNGLAIF